MTQHERVKFLIAHLLREAGKSIPYGTEEEKDKKIYRSLVNIRPPFPAENTYLKEEARFLEEELSERGVVDVAGFSYSEEGFALWRGDITRLNSDAIVNAANSRMLGCFYPCHSCIDNCIHTFAGVELRLECAEIMKEQGYEEPVGRAKRTKGYHLPCKYIFHTVGPIVYNTVTEQNRKDLASCYESCLRLADESKLHNIAFCCISTGEFRFPNEEAALIAVQTVRKYKEQTGSAIKVIFNVFKEIDYEIYKRILENN